MTFTTTQRAANFWQQTICIGDCILWNGPKNQYGYGRFWDGTRTVCVHRWSWEQVNGPMPSHLFAMHSCDTPACVNPDHIRPGTAKENADDASRKGRLPGSRPDRQMKTRKLSSESAAEIYRESLAGVAAKVLAKRYGVSVGLVSRIKHGYSWTHVTREIAKGA